MDERQHVTFSGNSRVSPDSETLIFCFSYADAVHTSQSSFRIVTVKMASDKPLPFAYQFAAGAVAGVSEVGLMTRPVLQCNILTMLTLDLGDVNGHKSEALF